MAINYELDLSSISLSKFKRLVNDRQVHPSRVQLYNGLDDILMILENMGIENLDDMVKALSTKTKIEKLVENTGISKHYLILLNREAKSYKTKIVTFDKFPDIDNKIVDCLKKHKLHSSKNFFEAVLEVGSDAMKTKLGFEKGKVLELFYLSDLVRVWGVGPVFARIILDCDIYSVKQLKSIDMNIYFSEFQKVNSQKQYTTARFSLNDVLYCQQMATELEEVDIN